MRNILSLLVLITFINCNGYCADVLWNTRREGVKISAGPIKMEDRDFTQLSSGAFTDVSAQSYLRLGLTERKGMDYLQNETKVRVTMFVTTYSDLGDEQTPSTQILEVIYSPTGESGITVDAEDYRMVGTHKFKAEVTSVSVEEKIGSVWVSVQHIPSFLFLEAGFSAERYYNLDMYASPVLHSSFINYSSTGQETVTFNTVNWSTTDVNTHEIEVSWDYIQGAEYYDLEWTWVDNYDQASTAILLTEQDFLRNSTRVRLGDQVYRIPQTFAKGFLVYRVRGVGRWLEDVNKEKFGKWSSGSDGEVSVSNWTNVITIAHEHEALKNWQYQATYAEDGKKKEVVQYFDGSLRNRQTVTRINSSNQSVVGETIYDNEGRGVIQVLPVPQENPSIQYYPGLNKNPQGQPYNFENFDVENPTTATGCTVNPAEPLSPVSGAGNYYSTAGHTTDTDWQKNVPDAEGYAFTQVEYTPDNTGRIRNQSGVGATHKIGSNHETYYYYLQPSQEELNRLFGYKIGYKQRYKKNMVVDANGQISVSYLDAGGKVIATAVVGESPDDLSALESDPGMGSVHTDLLNKQAVTDMDSPADDNVLYSTGRFGSEEDALKVGTQLGVTKDDIRYDFTYSATSSVYTEQACAGQPAKTYPYVYDLTISIKDNCGNELFTQTDTKLGIEQINGTANDVLNQATVNGIILDAGSYTVYKELKVNEDAYNHYLADYLSTDGNPCLAVESSFSTPIESDCDNSCKSCLYNLGEEDVFVLARAREEFGPTTTLANLDPIALQTLQQLYAKAKEECVAPCTPLPSCDSYWEMLRGDMMPDGQYGSKDPSDALSVYNLANDLTGNWQTPSLIYRDENGQIAKVEVVLISATDCSPAVITDAIITTDAEGKLWVAPNQLANVTDFLNAFQPSWADALVKFHPEYKLYLYTEEICTQTANVPMTTSTGTTEKAISSEMYDGYLRGRVSTLDQAQGNLQELYIDNGFYGLDYVGSNVTTDVITWPIFKNDPYFNTDYNAIHLLDLPNTTNDINNNIRKKELMIKSLGSYKNGIDMYTYAVRSVIGGYDLSTDISAYDTWDKFLSQSNPLTIAQKDQIWQAYKSFYLSEKARINQLMMDMYGFYQSHLPPPSIGIYNGAIGTGELSFGIALSFSGSSEYPTIIQDISRLWGMNTFPPNYSKFPSELAMPEYNSKEIRISRIDALNDNTVPVAVQMAEMSDEADYAMWQSTGQCPLTLDLERLLNQLAQQNALIGETPWNLVSAMTPDLIASLGLAMTDVTPNPSYSYYPNTKIKGEVTGNNLTINLTYSGITKCIATLSPVSTDFPWSTYGTAWKIYSVANSYAASSTSIQVLAKVGSLSSGSVKEIVLNFKTCMDIKSCEANFAANNALDGNCNKEEIFEADMQHLLQKLAQSGTLQNVNVSLNALPEYTESSLVDYFGVNATWNGTTGEITNVSEGKSFNLNAAFQPNVINISGFNLVGTTVYIQYLTFNTTTSLTGIENLQCTYSYTIEKAPIPLNFNCSCEEMNGFSVSLGTKADYDTKLKALFNHLLVLSSQNIIPPSGYSCSELDALSAFYGVDLALRLNSPSIYTRVSSNGLTEYYPSVNNSGTYLEYSIDFLNKKTGNSICAIGMQVHMDYIASYYWNNQNIVSLSFLETHTDHIFTFNVTNVVSSSNGNPIVFNDKYSCSPSFEAHPCTTCQPVAQAPISCTDSYIDYVNHMITLGIGNDIFIESPSMTPASYCNMREQHFCEMTYAYITEAYINYLNTMSVTNTTDLHYLTISEFGNTPIGYSNTQLNTAVTAFALYCTTHPNALWNTWINEVYITPSNPMCPVISPTPVYPEIPSEQTPCGQWSENISIVNAQNQYGIYLNQVAESFRHKYIKGAMESVVETFEETHKEKEYHYTLYYYDRSGNLTQTVPPNGVHRMELDQAQNTAINGIRSNNPGETVEDNVKAPIHTLTTDYRYNTLNQLVYQNTPDGGESRFAYDNLGRLVVSQNAKQKNNYELEEIHGTGTYESVLRPQFSYTLYDQLGRVVEVGEFRTTDNGYRIDEYGNFESSNLNFDINEAGWIYQPNFIREEVTRTIYDKLAGMKIPVSTTSNITVQAAFGSSYSKDNTRNRIVGVVYHSALNFDSDISIYGNGTFYDYDVHGNVKHLLQVNNDPTLVSMRQNIKHLQYEYDLVSGKVNKVYYQKGYKDQFIHRYHYDADNRITHVETSKDGFIFENDAKYFYYNHGPLARTEIGDKIVQAQDYAYTIQGWLKTVNGEELNENTMLGQDGASASSASSTSSPSINSGSTNSQVARDAYGYSLSYFDNDYKSANTAMLNYSASNTNLGNNLYNGNIRSMFTAISNTYENDPMAAVSPLKTHQTVYGYDQLNRIKTMNGFYRSLNETAPAASNYNSSYSYDGNGNLLTMTNRVDNGTQSGQAMDHFTYNYKANTNQLTHVNDDVTLSAIFTEDIDNQGTNNYDYDQIGQLTQDISEQIGEIKWSVTNKVKEVIYNGTLTGKKVKFDYNAMGNRIAKHETTTSNITKSTYYVLDAQGNAMSTYSHTTEAATANKLYLIERSIYGSSRLGMEQRYDEIAVVQSNGSGVQNPIEDLDAARLSGIYSFLSKNEIGDKRYELANHLGNVLNVVSDRKLPASADNATVAFYRADVVSYSDYFAFGMTMPGRHGEDDGYRYGFHGKEKVDEISGSGNSYDFGARIYDARLGRWLSLDPLAANYPSFSPYCGIGNNPIKFIDIDGREIINAETPGTANWKKVDAAIKKVEKTNPDLYNKLHGIPTKINITVGKLNPESVYSSVSDPVSSYSGIAKTPQRIELGVTSVKFSSNAIITGISNITYDSNNNPLDAQVETRLSGEEQEKIRDEVWNTDKENYEIKTNDLHLKRKTITDIEAEKLIKIEGEVNIVLDQLNISSKSYAKTLAHELGHAYFLITNPVKGFIWSLLDRNIPTKGKGHDINNPSGKEAENAEIEFEKNY